MVISLVILDRNLMVKPQNMFDPNELLALQCILYLLRFYYWFYQMQRCLGLLRIECWLYNPCILSSIFGESSGKTVKQKIKYTRKDWFLNQPKLEVYVWFHCFTHYTKWSETTAADPGLRLNMYHMDPVMGYVGALNSHSSHVKHSI